MLERWSTRFEPAIGDASCRAIRAPLDPARTFAAGSIRRPGRGNTVLAREEPGAVRRAVSGDPQSAMPVIAMRRR